MNKKPLVSIVIPSWNGIDFLKICLPSIQKQSFYDFEVIVVDNGSADQSVEYIQKKFPKFKVIPLPKNIGFGNAVNQGIEQSKGRYIFLLNNDTELDKDCLRYLTEAALSHKEVGMITSKMKNFYDRSLIDNAGDSIDIVGHSFTRGTGEKDGDRFDKAGYLFLVTGGGSIFKKELFEKVGLFDKDYFVYMEDVDLCFRAQLAGFKAWYEPKAVIYHMRMATSKKNMAFIEPECFRNMTMNIIKDYPAALLLHQFNWLKIILVNINTIIYLSRQGYLVGALKAELYILTHLIQLFQKRRKIQKLKNVTDRYIIEQVLNKKLKIPFLSWKF